MRHIELWNCHYAYKVYFRSFELTAQIAIINVLTRIFVFSAEELLEKVPDIAQGSPRYMAPEVALGIIKADSFEAYKKADMYSLGLIFFEIAQ